MSSDRSKPIYPTQRDQRPRWERDGGEGLPLLPRTTIREAAERKSQQVEVFLFTCTGCGRRMADPPTLPSNPCSCGGEIVGHTFQFDEYERIRWYGDPRWEGQ